MQKANIIRLENIDCFMVPLDTTANDQSLGSQAIMVSGIGGDISDDLLDMFFTNRRKSGGYEVMSPILMIPKEGKAVVTFKSPDGK